MSLAGRAVRTGVRRGAVLAAGVAGEMARRKVRQVGRDLAAPWREGRPGTAAEAGRWLGAGLAAGAFAAGLAAAVYVARKRPSRGPSGGA